MLETPSPVTDSPSAPTVPTPTGSNAVGRGIAVAAALIALGNIMSSVLGQVRNSIIAQLFGASPDSAAYVIASAVPNTMYDFLVGGLVSAALVPVFSELAERDPHELGRVAGTIFTMISLVISLAISVIWLLAPQLGMLLTSTQPNGLIIRPLATGLIRWMAPALLFMALTGLLTGLSQARHKFLLPAFAISLFNIGMIACALLLHRQLGILSLALGMMIGALAQVVLLLPTARGIPLRPSLNLRQPEVRRILRLYAPVVVGISFSVIGTVVDRRLASGVPQRGAAAIMGYATTLIQFGMGVITSAIALAALPTLSRQGVDPNNLGAYRRTLALSLKAVLLLILPAAVGLGVLARPIIMVLFERGAFTHVDTGVTTLALLLYVPSMIAAAIDQPLIFAFYARKNTLLPNLVQGAAIVTYLVVALSSVGRFGMYGLIAANVAQWTMHALIMLVLTHRYLGALVGQRLGEALAKGMLASLGMGCGIALLRWLMGDPPTHSWALVELLAGGAIGAGVYALCAALVRLETFELWVVGLCHRLTRHS
ncbi:MAG: murein biosynthesis integral membrane protein MurJ [Herpetosiphonaceae bacterium]|nr:murein biosynthesis integral membrane protein MurJ [Herpetosiphonaceae bacterium]